MAGSGVESWPTGPRWYMYTNHETNAASDWQLVSGEGEGRDNEFTS